MATKTPIFLTGATGYIGGTVLARLLEHPGARSFDITVLVRDRHKANILESAQFGTCTITAVVGTHQDHGLIERLAENAHFVFNLADADDVPLITAILRGMRQRHAKLGDRPVLIHTSGIGTLTDDARGQYTTKTIYDDLNVEQIKSIPSKAPHRAVDLLITAADTEGYVRSYIVLPSTIFGFTTHPLVAAGVSNGISIQIPALIRAALDRKQAGMVGSGRPQWPSVHIDDVADLYIQIFDAVLHDRPEAAQHGWDGFYFGENGEHSWYQISKAIGHVFVGYGISNDPEPTPFTTEELVKYFGSEQTAMRTWGTNARARGHRGRSIGWNPKHTAEDMLNSVQAEVDALLKRK